MHRAHPQRPSTTTGARIVASVGLASAMASAAAAGDPEIDALRQELAAQKAQIQQLLAAQAARDAADATKPAAARVVAVPAIDQAPATVRPGASIAVYGIADVDVARSTSGLGQKTTIGSGGMSASRIGIKGEREFGNGWKAIGLAEAGVLLDSGGVGNSTPAPGINDASGSSGGQNGTGTQLFSRQVYAGIASAGLGSVTIGRQYAGSYGIASGANAMGAGFFGYSGSFLPVVGMPTRVNNSIAVFSPNVHGLTGQLVYTTGSENNTRGDVPTAAGATTRTNDRAGRGFDLSATYANGPLALAASTWNIANTSFAPGETGLAHKTGVQASVSYDLRVVKLYATAVRGHIGGGGYSAVTKSMSSSSGWSVSAAVPVGQSRVLASYTSLDDRSALDRDGRLMGVAWVYPLYANTNVYAAWGKLANNRNASYSLADGGDLVGNVTRPGAVASGTMTGVNVAF